MFTGDSGWEPSKETHCGPKRWTRNTATGLAVGVGLLAACCPGDRGRGELGGRQSGGQSSHPDCRLLGRKGRGGAELLSRWDVFLEPLPRPAGPLRGGACRTGWDPTVPALGCRQVLPPQTSQLPWQQQGFPSLNASIHENMCRKGSWRGACRENRWKRQRREFWVLSWEWAERRPLRRFGGRRVCLGGCWGDTDSFPRGLLLEHLTSCGLELGIP